MQVGRGLQMHGQHVRAGRDERLEVAFGFNHHQVYVERDGCNAVERFDDRQANRDVGHEAPIHDVDMQQVGAVMLHGPHGVPKRSEVSRQNGRGDPDVRANRHRLTSSEIVSLWAICRPGSGACRMTTPGATPGYGWSPTTVTRKPLARRMSAAPFAATPMRFGMT